MDKKLLKRDISEEIVKYMDTENIIVLHGARQVGKSHILFYLENLLKKEGKPTFYIDLEDSRFVDILNEGVDALLAFLKAESFDLDKIKSDGKRLYLFIDEIQYLEKPSPLMKLLIDHHSHIQLIVSGSSSFNIKSKFSDSLVGRTVDFEIFNLSFAEFLRFKNIVYNLSAELPSFQLKKIKELYAEYMFFGGYPKIVLENSVEKKEKYLQQIIDTYIKKDIRDLANIKNIKKFNDLLKVLSSQSGQLLNVAELSRKCNIAVQTIESHLFLLENTYIIKLVSPFSTNSLVEVIKSPKVFFYDTGLLQMLQSKKLQRIDQGSIFETSIFSELVKKFGQEKINFWRNKNQNEIDFILQKKDGILPIEVKNNFRNFRKTSMSFFCEKYELKDYKVVSIEGEKRGKEYIYPWEI